MESLLHAFLRAQGYALLKPKPDGTFVLVSEAPQWFAEIWGPEAAARKAVSLGDASPFLENFLLEAGDFWKSKADEVCASGTWIETARNRSEIPLEAVALRLDGEALLSIHSPQKAFREQSQVFQTARESKLAHERLLREIQKKEILLHCIIHDLSQPLAAMRGCFECLAGETETPKAKRFIDIGKQQTERQEGMIREILRAFAEDLKAEMEQGGAGSKAADLLSCARDTIANFSPVFEAKGAAIQLSPQIDAAGDWRVAGDESRLRRIYSNLVENALRYAPRNSKVSIGMEHDGALLRAFVEDEGPGLPKGSTASNIFSLFAKGKEEGGKAGLGLYFCRVTVERWGGTIGCESRAGKGARFWFRLPRARAEADSGMQMRAATVGRMPEMNRATPRAAGGVERSASGEAQRPAPVAPPPERASRLRILLAEDQEDLRQLTGHLLKREGHGVIAVRNGREALRALAKHRFDVVLLDEEMPEMSGTEAVGSIRERERVAGGHQLVVALTGNTTEEDQQRLLAAGMDGCLCKPFRPLELSGKLAEAAALGAQLKEKPRAQEAALPKEELLARLGGDAKLLHKMIRTFRRDSVKKLAEMKRAITRRDGIALATAAHALKGSAGIFGSEKVAGKATQCAQRLQELGRRGDLGQAASVLGELQEAIALLHAKLRGYDRAESHSGAKTQRKKNRPHRVKRKRLIT